MTNGAMASVGRTARRALRPMVRVTPPPPSVRGVLPGPKADASRTTTCGVVIRADYGPEVTSVGQSADTTFWAAVNCAWLGNAGVPGGAVGRAASAFALAA